MYGIRWRAIDRFNEIATRERFFATEKARDRFILLQERKNNFVEVVAYSNPPAEDGTR